MREPPLKLPVVVGLEPLPPREVVEFAPPRERRKLRLDWFAADILNMKFEDAVQFESECNNVKWNDLHLWAKARSRE